ncbi:hypothetical protein [Luedemannella helvata]|uniref:Uncharacterized protein n=1 Tax=Luedemannella helvata TaxID=349315 RepID=A0ABP4VUG2_9ACTN
MNAAVKSKITPDVVRELARRGVLADHVRTLDAVRRRDFRIAAYELVWPVVFGRLTRRLEMRRGHPGCAGAVQRLRPECLDRFHDDVEAALEDLFRHARVPIDNLEGWVSSRLTAATVNAHRRRRGARGALQRPRVPKWLAAELRGEPRLTALAVDMLGWVGVEATAGPSVWPYTVWAERRSMASGDYPAAYRAVVADVETVLAAMRRRPAWYARYVERPLGRKQVPVLSGPESATEPTYLVLADRHETEDARLVELAAVAMDAIEARLASGEDARSAVVHVLGTVFGAGEPGHRPNAASTTGDQVGALLTDPEALDRIVDVLSDLLSGRPS